MKFLILTILFPSVLLFTLKDDKCTETKQIECADDIRAAYPACKKAAETGGSDMIADLTCIKYFNSMKSGCWSCICKIAEIDHLKVKGC